MVRAKPPFDRMNLPQNAAVLPRQPPGGDDDRRRGDLGNISGRVEHPVSSVFHYTPAGLRKWIMALKLKAGPRSADSYSGMVWVYDHVVFLGGVLNFELLTYCFF